MLAMSDTRLVIFDCDGVLVDSEVTSNEVLARELTAAGLATTLAQARRDYQGLLLEEIARDAGARLGRPLREDWISRYEQVRSEAFRRELRPIAGAAELVQAVRRAGIAVCVASQGALAKTRLSLELTGLAPYFRPEELFSAEQVARGKPFPDLFLHAAAAIGAPRSRCVVIEDTPSGARAAVAAGMRVLGYAPDSDAHALRDAGAEIVMSLAEVPALLGLP
jgi:HAD superfamily hydrolase (TIGR01509 family)